MSLSEEYKRQFDLRSWSSVFDLLPALENQVVLDLGCGMGDQAAELSARGARVIGVDANQELLGLASARRIPGAEFRTADLKTVEVTNPVDGIWCSFATAYFPDLGPTLSRWKRLLKPGGWLALTEVDHLFGHEPIQAETRPLLRRGGVKS